MFESSATKRRKAKEKAAVIAAALEAQNKAVPIIYTSVPGQKLTPALQEMQTSLVGFGPPLSKAALNILAILLNV